MKTGKSWLYKNTIVDIKQKQRKSSWSMLHVPQNTSRLSTFIKCTRIRSVLKGNSLNFVFRQKCETSQKNTTNYASYFISKHFN